MIAGEEHGLVALGVEGVRQLFEEFEVWLADRNLDDFRMTGHVAVVVALYALVDGARYAFGDDDSLEHMVDGVLFLRFS